MFTLSPIEQQNKPVSFKALVTPFAQDFNNGRPYYRINIKNNDDRLYQAYAWKNEYQGIYIHSPTQVIVTGIHKKNKGEARFQVLSISHSDSGSCTLNRCLNTKENSEITRLLQSGDLLEQQKSDLIKLQQFLDSIQQPLLKNFLQNVLHDELLINAFVELPASARHHHSERGGLLNHSIECAVFVFNATQGSMISRDEREIATVAGLLHDIGKIKTLTEDNKHSSLGHHIQHEQLTLPILAVYLTELERDWPAGAALLMHILTWEKKNQLFPGNPTALLIKTADQFSTAMDIRKQALKQTRELLLCPF